MLKANEEDRESQNSRPKTRGNRTDKSASPQQQKNGGGDYESNDPQNKVESV